MNDEAVRDLATRAGIAVEWHDIAGHHHIVSPDVLRHILDALGLPCGTRGDLVASRKAAQPQIQRAVLPPLITATAGQTAAA